MDAPEQAAMGWVGKAERRGFGRREEVRALTGLRPARATTRLATASKDEQRGQRDPGRLDQVRSAVTRKLSFVVVKKFSVQRLFKRQSNGQQPRLGSGYMAHRVLSGTDVRPAPRGRLQQRLLLHLVAQHPRQFGAPLGQ